MSSIIRSSFRTTAASNFIDAYASQKRVYVAVGRDVPWANESIPPVPADTISESNAVFDSILGAHLVKPADISMVVRRIDWIVTAEYFVLDVNSSTLFVQDTYALTSTFRVYKCVSKDTSGTTYPVVPLAINEPTGVGVVDTADGYTWEFLYDLSSYNFINVLTPYWIPVNYGASITTEQTASGDINAHKTLRASKVIIVTQLTDTDISNNITYRQISLIENPVLVSGGFANQPNYQNPSAPNAVPAGTGREWVQYSGDVIYQENRIPITRSMGQYEEIKIVIEF